MIQILFVTACFKLLKICRKSLDLLAVQNHTSTKWHDKSDVAIFRGRDSRRERLNLVQLSEQYPDIIDAKLTAMFFFKKEQDDFEIAKRMSFYDFFKVCAFS